MIKSEVSIPSIVEPHPPLERYYDQANGKRSFVKKIFDEAACDYDRVEGMMALGSGSWYRRSALQRAGLVKEMKVLDVAVGTGLVSREAVAISGKPQNVIGLDPSIGMLTEAGKSLSISLVMGVGEHLPMADESFDFLSMGYALRHLSDLVTTFREFHRVLKPGGKICVLEITRPKGFFATAALRLYMKTIVPTITRITSPTKQSSLLWDYYWETIEACIAPERVIAALAEAGFQDVKRYRELGIFSEYTGHKI